MEANSNYLAAIILCYSKLRYPTPLYLQFFFPSPRTVPVMLFVFALKRSSSHVNIFRESKILYLVKQSQRVELYKGGPWLNCFLYLITPPLHNLWICLTQRSKRLNFSTQYHEPGKKKEKVSYFKYLEQMNAANKSGTGNNGIFINNCLLQVSLNLAKKGSISNST